MSEPVRPLTDEERRRIAVQADKDGLSVEDWCAYQLRACLALGERLDARTPAEGGMGR